MISIYAGKNGSGKSYNAVKYAVSQMCKGRLVFSDMPIFCTVGNKLIVTAKLTKSMIRDFDFPEGCLVIINEADSWFNCRNSREFTVEDLIVFSQSRHIDIDLVIVAKRFTGVDTNIRSCCDDFCWMTRFPKWQKIRPFFFKLTHYETEEDFLAKVPVEKPTVNYVLFSQKIAQSYDTRYQRNILHKRPKKNYTFWEMEHYEPHLSLWQKIKGIHKNLRKGVEK